MPRARMQAIASLELRTQLRGAPFWTLLLIVVAATSTLNPVAMIRGGGETVDGVRAFANSVHALAPTFAMSAFFVYPFFVALMAGLTVLRDDEVGMTDLIGSSPVSTREYLVAKLAGVVAALLLALGVHLLVVMAFRESGVGGVARGPFSLASYVVPLVVLALPGVLWMAGLAFALGAATRRPMLVYALPTALYVAQFALFWNWHPVGIAPWLDHTLMVLDPTGLRWLSHSLFAEDRGLGYYNTAPLALDATIVAGRLLTLMVPAAAVWALGVRRARRTDAPPSGAAMAVTARPTRATFAPLGELRMQSRAPGWFAGLRTVLTAELRELRAQPAGYLFGIALLAIVMEVGGGEVDDYGLPLLTSAGDFAVRTIPVVTVLVCLYLLFTVVEMMHRDRATGFESLALSSPIPTTAMLSGRGIAALTLVVVLGGVRRRRDRRRGAAARSAHRGRATAARLWPRPRPHLHPLDVVRHGGDGGRATAHQRAGDRPGHAGAHRCALHGRRDDVALQLAALGSAAMDRLRPVPAQRSPPAAQPPARVRLGGALLRRRQPRLCAHRA
ncbi:MAG: hypothetical protein IPF47_20795 [Gemmatimonadetes bacterium]|nr:hypothetical protein [Gemmatimonadota bacterium]